MNENLPLQPHCTKRDSETTIKQHEHINITTEQININHQDQTAIEYEKETIINFSTDQAL